MADIFDEVAEDLRAERAKRLAQRYGGWLLGAALLAVAAAGTWQVWKGRQAQHSASVAGSYLAALHDADAAPGAPANPARAEAELTRIADTAPDGYRTLARLRLAAIRADAGDLPAANALWDQVANDGAADRLLRDLATLLWAQRQVDAGDPAAIRARLQPLLDQKNAWRSLAQETEGLLSLRLGKTDEARATFRQLQADPNAPGGVRARAEALLARLDEGAPPVGGAPPAGAVP